MKAFYNLGDQIYWITFSDRYSLCLTFLRVAETRESTYPDVEKGFTLVDYMEWYAKEYGKGAFTYPNDWAGFNVHHDDFKAALSLSNIKDFNKYDKFMTALRGFIESMCPNEKFYLIGTVEEDYDTLKHEYAHALWCMNTPYQEAQKSNINSLDEKQKKVLCSNLLKMGYKDTVHEDEIQAYLSTGFILKDPKDRFHKPIPKKDVDKLAKSFIAVFAEYSKGKLPRKKI